MGRGLSFLTALVAAGTPQSLAGSCDAMLVSAAAHACALSCVPPQPQLGILGWATDPHLHKGPLCPQD